MSKPTPATPAAPKSKPTPAAPASEWKPSYRFVDYKRRRIIVKLVDEELGFKAGESVMTATGPMPISRSVTITIDRDGYVAKTENEERALLKLANKPVAGSPGGSYLVTWEHREMPPEQAKAELSAAGYKRRIAELEDAVATKAEVEAENARQAEYIANLEAQLKAAKGG